MEPSNEEVMDGELSLIESNIQSERLGCSQFVKAFRSRYGLSSPRFFEGTLNDAVAEAFDHPPLKVLGVYLHYEHARLTSQFCKNMTTEPVVAALSNTEDLILWGWDVSYSSNWYTLFTSVSMHLSVRISEKMKTMVLNKSLPAILFIVKNSGNFEISQTVYSWAEVSDFFCDLSKVNRKLESLRLLSANRNTDEQEEKPSIGSIVLNYQAQEEEFLRNLSDLMIENQIEVNKTNEMLAILREEAAQAERERDNAAAALQNFKSSASRPQEPIACGSSKISAEEIVFNSIVNKEPSESEPNIIILKFITEKTSFQRRFRETDQFQTVIDFVRQEGFGIINYKMLVGWPRVEYFCLEPNKTLKDLLFKSRDTIILEERK